MTIAPPALPLPSLREGLSLTLDKGRLEQALAEGTNAGAAHHELTEGDPAVRITFTDRERTAAERKQTEDLILKHTDVAQNLLESLHHENRHEAIVITIPAEKTVGRTLRLSTQYTGGGFCTLLIIAGKGSKAMLTRTMGGEGRGVVCERTIIIAAEDAHISYNERQVLGEEQVFWSQKKGEAQAGSRIEWYCQPEGSNLSITQTQTALAGTEASTLTLAAAMIDGHRHADIKADAYHLAPKTSSGLYTKAVVDGNAKLLHRGVVDIAPSAEGSSGYQRQDAMIVSDHAEADVIPKLAIRNGEVQCSHGGTVGHLDEETVFYLESRGFSLEEAKRLVIDCFLASVAERTENEEWRAEMLALQELAKGRREKKGKE